jgi:hypothetical protein
MGHCEMLLAVAGLDQKQLEQRTRLLASRDWDSLPAFDRAAFFFAKKSAKTPWAIDDDDRSRLIAHFGHERALDVIWWNSRCHYMTRVADGFQLPLERENVFAPPPPAVPAAEAKTPK